MRAVHRVAWLPALLAMTTVVLAACSSSGTKTSSSTGSTATTAAVTATTTAPIAATASTAASTTASTTAAASTSGLSGTWSGHYSGKNSGTFTLNWQQSGSNLTGTINISQIGSPVDISGTVQGSTIKFGTLGAGAITYTGTVSGNSMSGTYKDPAESGTWTATKQS